MNVIERWKEKITQYAEVRLNLIKLTFIERTSNVLSYFIFIFMMIFMVVAVLVFLGTAFAYWMADVMNSRPAGFLGAAGLYILFVVIAVLLRKNIINGFSGIFIRVLTAAEEEDEEEEEQGKKN